MIGQNGVSPLTANRGNRKKKSFKFSHGFAWRTKGFLKVTPNDFSAFRGDKAVPREEVTQNRKSVKTCFLVRNTSRACVCVISKLNHQ